MVILVFLRLLLDTKIFNYVPFAIVFIALCYIFRLIGPFFISFGDVFILVGFRVPAPPPVNSFLCCAASQTQYLLLALNGCLLVYRQL